VAPFYQSPYCSGVIGQFVETYLPTNQPELGVTANYHYAFSDHFLINFTLFHSELTSTIRILFTAIVEGVYLNTLLVLLGVSIFVWYAFMHVSGQ
jgi:hypothetical protein